MAAIGLKTQIWNNNLRSMLIMGFYPFLLMGLVWSVVAGYHSMAAGIEATPVAIDAANAVLAQYWPVIVAVVAVWFCISWFSNVAMVRAMTHAQKVTRAVEPALYNMLENMCIARGMNMPALQIIETPARNAFASGVSSKNYAITLTRGLIDALEEDEIEAVLGHELTHIINHDVRLLMVCIIFTGMIGFCAQALFSMARHGTGTRASSSKDGRNSTLVLLVISLILYIGYAASCLARFAVSRRREYMADAGSIELTKNPDAMMRALLRIAGQDRIPEVTDDIAMMCIENSVPFFGLFATHPPINARIQAIAAITGTPVPDLAAPHKANPWA